MEHEEAQTNTCSFEVLGDPLFASNWTGFNGSLPPQKIILLLRKGQEQTSNRKGLNKCWAEQ